MLSRRAGFTSQLQTRGSIGQQASARVSRKQKVPSTPLAAEGSHKEIATPPPKKKFVTPFPIRWGYCGYGNCGPAFLQEMSNPGRPRLPVPLTCHLARPLPCHGKGMHPFSLSPCVQETLLPTEWPPCFLLVPPKVSPLNCLKR